MRLKKVLGLFFLLFLIGITCLIVGVLYLGLENTPRVGPGTELTVRNVERAKRLLDENDPRRLRKGQRKSLSVQEDDLNLVLRYGLSRLPGGSRIGARVDLEPEAAVIDCTMKLPQNPLRNYLNLSATLERAEGMPRVISARIGKIRLPGPLARPAVAVLLGMLKPLPGYPEVVDALHAVHDYRFEPDRLTLAYEWRPDVARRLTEKGREILVPEDDRERIVAYADRIAAASYKAPKSASLSSFLPPVFTLAKERSEKSREPALENRAAILAVALFALNRPVSVLIGGKGRQPAPFKTVEVTLRSRNDLAKHFMLSAAIAATADSRLSNAIGLFKEIDDSRGGTGFSFADLAADRAGVRFAELATSSDAAARRLQDRMRISKGEPAFMPAIDHLPEGLQEAAFKQRYQDLDSARFASVKSEIERRIDACGLYAGK